MTQPCLVPFVTGKASDVVPRSDTRAIIPSWNERMTLASLYYSAIYYYSTTLCIVYTKQLFTSVLVKVTTIINLHFCE